MTAPANLPTGSAFPERAASAAASWPLHPARPRLPCGRRASMPRAIPISDGSRWNGSPSGSGGGSSAPDVQHLGIHLTTQNPEPVSARSCASPLQLPLRDTRPRQLHLQKWPVSSDRRRCVIRRGQRRRIDGPPPETHRSSPTDEKNLLSWLICPLRAER